MSFVQYLGPCGQLPIQATGAHRPLYMMQRECQGTCAHGDGEDKCQLILTHKWLF